MALDSDDCLLSMDSLKDDSLWDTDMQSLRGACDRKCRQGTLSASVSLLSGWGTWGEGGVKKNP